ncbi:hypothetical protein F4780DRAFT_604812 [Xylariomycetidae sp. FL0641]|nr:hypothetical protein F4780DRAFT_604812 [Xylariomycetidae sp. FL0641]
MLGPARRWIRLGGRRGLHLCCLLAPLLRNWAAVSDRLGARTPPASRTKRSRLCRPLPEARVVLLECPCWIWMGTKGRSSLYLPDLPKADETELGPLVSGLPPYRAHTHGHSSALRALDCRVANKRSPATNPKGQGGQGKLVKVQTFPSSPTQNYFLSDQRARQAQQQPWDRRCCRLCAATSILPYLLVRFYLRAANTSCTAPHRTVPTGPLDACRQLISHFDDSPSSALRCLLSADIHRRRRTSLTATTSPPSFVCFASHRPDRTCAPGWNDLVAQPTA